MSTTQMTEPFIPRWDVLPSPALEAIFQHLGTVQLAQVRLMCRHWNATVCQSPELMENFVPKFYKQSVFAETDQAEQEEMSVLLSGRFSSICIDVSNVRRAANSPLWTKLGPVVRRLVVCNEMQPLDVADVLALLRMVPNVVRLEIFIEWAEVTFSVTEADFKLEQLEELLLATYDTKWLELLSGICPKVKAFKYYGGSGLKKSFTVADMMPFILAHQETLQKITIKGIDRNANSLKLIASAKKLKLNVLTFEEDEYQADGMRGIVYAEDVLPILQSFPTLHSLKFKYNFLDTKVIKNFQANLGQLRKLGVNRYKPDEFKSLKMLLSKMSQLEYLSVEAYITWEPDYFLDLRGVSCPNLKKLKISDFIFQKKGLAGFFQNSPKINFLSMQTFVASNKKHLMQTLGLLKSLETLIMYENGISESDLGGFRLNSLRVLCCNCIPLALRCPSLETVRIRPFLITDEDIFGLLRGLPRLRQLIIDQCEDDNEITDAALDYLAVEGRRLEILRLELIDSITTQAARDRLTEALKDIVQFRFQLNSKPVYDD